MSSENLKPLSLVTPESGWARVPEDAPASSVPTSVRRHAIAVLATILLITMGAAAIVWQIPSRYAATASVQVQTRSSKLRDIQAVSYDSQSDPNIVTTEIDVLRSNDLALDVVRALQLDQNLEFVGPAEGIDVVISWIGESFRRVTGGDNLSIRPPAEAVAMKALLDRTTVVNKDRSNLIGITVETRNAALSVRVADAYAEQYLAFRRGMKAAAILRANAMLVDHMLALKQRALAAERAAEEFRQKNGLMVVAGAARGGVEGPTIVGQQLAELNTQLVAASNDRAEKEAYLQQVRTLVNAGQADKAPQVLASPVIQHLLEQEADLAGRQAGVASRVVPGSPLLIAPHAQIGALRGRITVEVNKAVAGLSSQVDSARAREASLRKQLEQLRDQLNNQGSESVRLRELGAEAAATSAIYEDFLAQGKRTASGADMQLPDAELIATAKEPLKATYPKRGLVVMAAFAASCIMGVLLSLLLERNHVGFRSSEEFEAETGTPILGLVPTIPRRLRRRFNLNLQPAQYNEALSAICARLWARDFTGRSRVIMVTSAVPAEAKTWLAMSLGASFARGGGRVLLIDCDVRRGTIARALGLSGPGLSNLFGNRPYERSPWPTGKAANSATLLERADNAASVPGPENSVLDAARRAGMVTTIAPGFDVIPIFPNSVNPADFLTAAPLRDLIEHARSSYDVIILDTPPVMVVADGLLVSRLADCVIVGARWSHTPRPVVASAIRSLNECGAYVAGAVLTMVNMRSYAKGRLGSHAYVYSNYAGYYGKA